MTISSSVNTITYTGNGSTVAFPIPFPFTSDSHIVVTQVLISTKSMQILSSGVYTVVGAGNPAGGTLNYTPSTGPLSGLYQIIIERLVPYRQELDIFNQGGFFPEAVEAAFDNLEMQIQQLSGRIPAKEASRLYGTNAVGSPVNYDLAGLMSGSFDAKGPLAGRSVYDAQPSGFTYLATDSNPLAFYLRSGPTGSWDGPFLFGLKDNVQYGDILYSAAAQALEIKGYARSYLDRAAAIAATIPSWVDDIYLLRTGTHCYRIPDTGGLLYNQFRSNGGTIRWQINVTVLDFAALGVKGDDTDESSIIAGIMNSIPTMQVAQYYKPTCIVLEGGKRYYAPGGVFQIFQNHSIIRARNGMAMMRGDAYPALTVSHNNSVNIPLDCDVQSLWLCNDPASGSGNPALIALSTAYLRVERCIVAPPDADPASGASPKACSGPGIEVKFSTSAQFHRNIILRPGNHGIYCHAGRKDYVGPATVYGGSTALELFANRIAHLPAGTGVFARQVNNVFSTLNKIEDCSSGGMILDSCQDFSIARDYFEVCGTDIIVRTATNEFPGLVTDTPVLAGTIEDVYSTSTNGILVGTTGNVDGVIARDNQVSGFSQFYATANKCIWGRQRRMVGTFSNLGTNTIREDDLYATATLDIASLAAGATRNEITVTCTGAAVGDFVELVGHSGDLLGVTIDPYVSAANTITPRSFNGTSGAVDPASMNFKYRVKKA